MADRKNDYEQLKELAKTAPENPNAGSLSEDVARQQKEISFQGRILNITLGFVIAVLATLFIGYLTFLFSYFNEYNVRLKELRDERFIRLEKSINELNDKIGTPSPTPKTVK